MSPQAYRDPNRDTIYRECLAIAGNWSADEVLARIDAETAIALDPRDPFPGDVGRYMAHERLRALYDELARKARVLAETLDPQKRADNAAWRDAARQVREHVELPLVFEMANYLIRPAGKNGRRGVAEYHAACLVCGGYDRLVIWAGPNGNCWCRQCGWRADTLAVCQSLFKEGFRDSVRRLTPYAALPGAA